MNVHKNMEVIFVTALAAVSLTSWMLDSLPAAQAVAKKPVVVERSIATPTSMAIVVIKAPRARNAD